MSKEDKIIKDLKERNNKLSNQRREYEIRFYNQQYLTDKLEHENKELQARIDKAVKYLEEPNRDKFDISYAKMLEILKEADNV